MSAATAQATPATTPAQAPTALRAYRIKCAGLEYAALATSTCMAVLDAMALHGPRAVSASPMVLRKGGAA